MRIGIISDTHGCLTTWNKVYQQYFEGVDLIIHAGDVLYHGPRNKILDEYDPAGLAKVINDCPKAIIVANGNCDAAVDSMVLDIPVQSPFAYIVYEGLKIIVNHGHDLSKDDKVKLAEKFKADLFITGHTHIPELFELNGVVYLNPGSPAMSKRTDGKGTIAILDDKNIKVIDIENGQVLLSHIRRKI